MKRLLMPLVILLSCAFAVTGCKATTPTSPASPAATTPKATTSPAGTATKYGGSLRIVEAVAPGSPLGVIWETVSANPSQPICLEPLFKEALDGTLNPLLATSYDIDASAQAPSITLHLKKGVKFQDGTDFNAQAVKWNFEQERTAAAGAGGTRYWKTFNVIDDYTIKTDLTQFRNSLMPFYATNSCYMVSPTAYDKNGIEWMRWHMVGTGPFVQTDFQRDVSLTAIRNTNYHVLGKPYLDKLTYLFVPDETTRTALYKSDGAEILNCAGNGRLATELKSSGRSVVSQLSGVTVLMPDGKTENSPWANTKVRMAAEYAIDKEAIAKTFGYGFWQAAYQLPSPNNKAYIPNLVGRKYDVAKAKQLLTEAGFPNGFKTKIIAQNTENRDVLVAIQASLGQAGIQVDLDFPEPAKYVTYSRGTWENALLYTGVGENANYNVTFGFMLGVPQPTYKSLKQPDTWPDLYNSVMVTPQVDPKLQQKAIQALVDDASLIPMVYTSDIWVLKSNIQDAGYGLRGRYSWNSEDAWLSK